MYRTCGNLWALIVVVALVASCTEASLQAVPPDPPPILNNLLRIDGEYCTQRTTNVTYPVKVLFLVDQSASLQCTDSQNRRFAALNQAVNDLLAKPNTRLAFVGFSSWSRYQSFTRNRGEIAPFLDPAGGLGPATDYQGALATALSIIEQDLQGESPAVRARTRYNVVFVSDGVPEPRCNAGCEDDRRTCSDGVDNDGDGLIDAADPDCANVNDNTLAPDNLYGVCNTTIEIPDGLYVDMSGICPEYNQPPQILRRVQDILELKDIYGVGEITLSTVLLFSSQGVVESVCPGAGAQFGYTRSEAMGLLQQMAAAGNGTFRDVNLDQPNDAFLRFDVASLRAELSLLSFMAVNEHSVLTPDGLMSDMDRDTLADVVERAMRTHPENRDSDGDRYTDAFEAALLLRGFDPRDANMPPIPCESNRDGDGDGLKDCEEFFLGTDPSLADTDNDNVTDWHEFVAGMNPLVDDARHDSDFDGIINIDELRAGTNPTHPDADYYRAHRMLYGIEDLGMQIFINASGNEEERHCYRYSVDRIPMVITPLPKERGLNRLMLYAFEGPARLSGVPREVRVACLEAFYTSPTLKHPASGRIDVSDAGLTATRERLQLGLDLVSLCPLFDDPASVSRDDLLRLVVDLLPSKVQLGQRLYNRAELVSMVEGLVDDALQPALPARAFEIFVPLQSFRADRHCYRPWGFDLLLDFLALLEEKCVARAALSSTPQ